MKHAFSVASIATLAAFFYGDSHAEVQGDAAERIVVDTLGADSKNNFVQEYDDGKTLVFDFSNDTEKKEKTELMNEISGMSITDAKTVYIKKGKQGAKYLVIEKDFSPERIASALEKFEEVQSESKSRRTKRSLGVTSAAAPDVAAASPIGHVVTVTMLAENISCNMPKHELPPGTDLSRAWKNPESIRYSLTQIDYCDANASVELNYKVDMFGSKISSKADAQGRLVRTEEGKYLMVTVSPNEEGGTGWHLADDLKQEQTFISEITPDIPGKARGEIVGPFANKYQFWIKKTSNDAAVRLVETYPQNTNPNISISDTRGITVGISGMIGATVTVGGSGSVEGGTTPKPTIGGSGSIAVEGQLIGTVQQSNSRNVSYATQEYTVENKSAKSDAKWTWNAKIAGSRICDYLQHKDLNTCFSTLPLLDEDTTIIDADRLSALSYASFTPSIQAIYKTAKETDTVSTFEFGSGVETGVLLGKAVPVLLPELLKPVKNIPGVEPATELVTSLVPNVLKFTAEVKTGTVPDVKRTFNVDWNAVFFSPEANLRLQVISEGLSETPETLRTLCLSADATTNKVTLERCSSSRSQVWGYDAEEKLFKSRAKPNHCLVYPNLALSIISDHDKAKNGVEIRECSRIRNNQKWVLRDDGFLAMYSPPEESASYNYGKVLGYEVIDDYLKDAQGNYVVKDNNYVLIRVPYTYMRPSRDRLAKKIQAFPANL